MFNFLNQEVERREKEKAKSEIIGAFMEEMAKSILNDPDTDEATRLSFLIVFKSKSLHEAINACVVEKYADPKKGADVKTLKEVLDYLTLVELGIKQFSEVTPLVKNEND